MWDEEVQSYYPDICLDAKKKTTTYVIQASLQAEF
jgi:hypothetical protein